MPNFRATAMPMKIQPVLLGFLKKIKIKGEFFLRCDHCLVEITMSKGRKNSIFNITDAQRHRQHVKEKSKFLDKKRDYGEALNVNEENLIDWL